MAMISGRPISFQKSLFDALFIKRAVVEPELFASLRPVTYSGGLGQPTGATAVFPPPAAPVPSSPPGFGTVPTGDRSLKEMEKAGLVLQAKDGKSNGWSLGDDKM